MIPSSPIPDYEKIPHWRKGPPKFPGTWVLKLSGWFDLKLSTVAHDERNPEVLEIEIDGFHELLSEVNNVICCFGPIPTPEDGK
jgi:hypothetical protein